MLMKQKNNSKSTIIIIAVVAVALIAAIAAYFVYQNNTRTASPAGSRPDSKTVAKDPATATTSIGSSKDNVQTKDSPVTTPPSSITPQTPVGTFVSNHRPNIGGSPAPNMMDSTCTTTVGSYCKITFTKDSTTVSLPDKQTDASGNVSWSWKLQDIGLTEGTWSISAVATNGSKTASANDSMALVVGP